MRASLSLLALLVCVAPLNARTAATVGPALSEPSLSPDHREIAFVSGGDIWTVPATGGDAHLLISHPATESRPLWSPDGGRIAFVSTRSGNGDIYVLTLATGELKRITFDDVSDVLDGWSRDGKFLYFSSTSRDIAGMADVWRVKADGGTPMQVAADRYATEYFSAPSPGDASTIAITARGMPFGQWWRHGRSHIDESEIWLVHDVAPASASTPRYEPVTSGGAKSLWPMWSADASTIYFVSDRSGQENLWSRNAKGGEATQLTHFTDGRVLFPSISADGLSITFERGFSLWTYDVASRQAKQVPVVLKGASASPVAEHQVLTNGFQQLALAPDGRKIAFIVHGEVFAASSRDGGEATRVTTTPGPEEQLAWAPDSRRIVYSSERGNAWHLYLYDFSTRTETQLTKAAGNDVAPRWSPDGKRLAYMHDARELRVLDASTGQDKVVATAVLDRPPFLDERGIAWSPDSRWLAYVAPAGSKAFKNVFIVSVDGGASRQVSWLSNSGGGGLSWSADGTFITLESTQRTEEGQLIRIDLVPRTPRFREDQFRDLFNTTPARSPNQQPAPSTTTAATQAPSSDSGARRDSIASARRSTTIVFEDIRRRMSSLPVGVDVNSAVLSPDGRTVLLTAAAAGQRNLYTYSLDDIATNDAVARQLTSTPGFKSSAQWSQDGREVYYLENGRISSMNVETRVARPINVSAELDVDFNDEKSAIFQTAWSYLRDNFFDAKMHGADWNAMHEEYGARVAAARTPDEMRRLMNLMIGELNASHLGIGGPAAQQPYTGRIGVRFDHGEYEKNGALKVSEVIALSPAALAKIGVGDVITAVDGKLVTPETNFDELMSYRIGKQTTLSVTSARDASRQVTLRPVNAGTEKGLLYRAWVESRREYVNRVSGGRLGYVHMVDMSDVALRQLYVDLDAEQHDRDGIVIDVRNNNGGFVNAYALDVFSRKPYLNMQGRGNASATGARTALGQRSLEKPTVLVTNQHSLSDAEDFTEGYRAMKLGPVVGEPTAGWIIYTSNRTLLDGTTVRLPGTRITDANGKDMELVPRSVDVTVIRPVGESYSGRDSQLDAAVKTLLASLPSMK